MIAFILSNLKSILGYCFAGAGLWILAILSEKKNHRLKESEETLEKIIEYDKIKEKNSKLSKNELVSGLSDKL